MKSYLKIFFMLLLLCCLTACSNKKEDIDYAIGVSDVPDLAGKKVALLAGTIYDLELSKLSPAPNLLRLNSVPEVISAVECGQADYCINDNTVYIDADMEGRGLKNVFNSSLMTYDVGLAFRKDEQGLVDEFNEFLRGYRADGRYDELLNRWTQGKVSKVVMPKIEMNRNGETLKVGSVNNFPFSFIQNGAYAGLEIELLEVFAAETGRNLDFCTIDFGGMIAALTTGKIDISACCIFITEERSKQVLFADPHYECNASCYCRDPKATIQSKSFFTTIKDSFHDNLIVESRWKLIVQGFWETLIISLCAILLGTIFGCLICWMRMSSNKILSGTAKVYIDIIRGVPILVLLMMLFYVVFASGDISPRMVAIIAFAMNFGAYVSEMFRSGIQSVDQGQTEAGLAMGFTPVKTFFYFIVPQAAKQVLPVFKGEAVSLFKNTSVVGFIAILDLTKASEVIRARTFDAFFPLIIISIIYFILAWLLGKTLDRLAKKIA